MGSNSVDVGKYAEWSPSKPCGDIIKVDEKEKFVCHPESGITVEKLE